MAEITPTDYSWYIEHIFVKCGLTLYNYHIIIISSSSGTSITVVTFKRFFHPSIEPG